MSRVMFSTDDPAVIDKAAAIPDIRFLELAGELEHDEVEASAMIPSGSNKQRRLWDRGIHGEDQVIGMLEEEEVPRDGTEVVRTVRLTRWSDSRHTLWSGRNRTTGAGEGRSSFRTDVVLPAGT